jgi:hypothetical protein
MAKVCGRRWSMVKDCGRGGKQGGRFLYLYFINTFKKIAKIVTIAGHRAESTLATITNKEDNVASRHP